ncbi:HtaA domain-containing protein [Salana multivorans]|nr:HtaA domain-containing protein [Salana multivorans]
MLHPAPRLRPDGKAGAATRWLAALVTSALVALGAIVGIAVPASAAGPEITVTEAPRDGGNVTVSGTGFNADPAANGIYLGLRVAGTGSDVANTTFWIAVTNDVGSIPGLGGTAPMNPDGSFSITMPVPAFDGTDYVIATRQAHGGGDATQVVNRPVVYAAPPVVPPTTTTTALSLSEATVVEGTDVTATATVSPAAAGTVTFTPGGSATVSEGVASVTLSDLPVGTTTVEASFVPADPDAYAGSSAEPRSVVVTAKPTEPEEPVWEPAIEVFLNDSTTPYAGEPVYDGDVLTVKGTGFDPNANVGGRGIPIPNTLPQGDYVVLGSFLPTWKPSEGVAGTARKTVDTKWAVTDATFAGIPPQYQGTVAAQRAVLGADGTFTTTLEAKSFSSGLAGGVWGVYTYGAGGVNNASQELTVPVDYRGERPTEPVFEPAIQVFLEDGTTPYTGEPVYDGDKLVVKGTGFDPSVNISTRPPVTVGDAAGNYVVLGSFLPAWKPSEGAQSTARKIVDQRWAMTDATFDNLSSAYVNAVRGQRVVLGTDGTFSATLEAKSFSTGLAGGVWGVYTYPAGGPTNAVQELTVPVDYRGERPTEPVFEPAIQVFLADGTTPYTGQSMEPGDTLVVKGTGFDPAANVGGMGQPIPANLPQGTFVVFGNFSPTWKPSESAASSARQSTTASRVWALAESVLDQVPTAFQPAIRASWADIAEDGSFTATVTLQNPTTLATDGAWGIYTYPGGVGTPANPAQELSVPVTYEPAGSTDPEPQPGPRVTVTPRTLDVTVENVVTVSGTGFTGPGAANGAYVVLGETSLWSGNGPLPGAGWDVLAWVMPTQITDGAFSVTLTVPAGKLDPTKAYQVATSAAHALSATNRSLDTFTSLVVHGTPVETPDLALAITQDGAPVTSVVQGSTVSITGTGFAAGEQVSAVVTSDPVALGERTADANGTVTFEWTVPADFEATAHTVTLTGATSGSVEGSLTVTEASGEPQEPAVCDATFAWGIKSSFRTYLARDFVNGSITTSGGVTQRADNGIFDWSAQAGDLDLDAGTGSVTFPGSVRFTGHEGALDLTFTNVTFRLTSPTTAQIVVDYTGREFVGMNPGDLGSEISGTGIVLADVTFEKSSTAEAVTITGPATLAASGAEAFGGFYTAGEELDAFALVVPLTNECGETPNPGTPGGNEPTPTPTEDTPAPTTPATPAQCVPVPASAVKAGAPGTASLSWGVKTSFRNYVTGPIANGSISGSTTFYGSPGSITTTNRTGTASFGGSVSFSGHDGALSLHISNPSVKITSATSAQLVASVSSKGYNGSGGLNGTVVLATVSLPSPSASGDSITWRGAGVTLTAEGAKAFGGFYSAGESMDSLTLTVTPAVAGSIDTAGLPALADGAVYCDDLASTGAGSTDGLGLAAVALLALGVVLVATRRRSLIGG